MPVDTMKGHVAEHVLFRKVVRLTSSEERILAMHKSNTRGTSSAIADTHFNVDAQKFVSGRRVQKREAKPAYELQRTAQVQLLARHLKGIFLNSTRSRL